MKKGVLLVIILFFGLVIAGSATANPQGKITKTNLKPVNSKINTQISKVSIPFIKNKGQYNSNVKYYAKTFYGTVFITSNGIIHNIINKKGKKGIVLEEQFLNNKGEVIQFTPIGTDPSPTKISYFKGSMKNWKTNLKTYNQISLGTLYPGVKVDLRAHFNNVEKIYSILPGADPSNIKIRVLGSDGLKTDKNGDLIIKSSFGNIHMSKPVAYQKYKSKTYKIHSNYQLQSNIYSYNTGKYDHTQKLTIDPYISYSGYVGGLNEDYGNKVAVDFWGNAYITGYTNSTDLPVKIGPTLNNNGDIDAFIAKINPNGILIYCGYIGGSYEDAGNDIAVDSRGNAYITGQTLSTDLPVKNGPGLTKNGGHDAFIAKINPLGTGLVYCGYIGGSNDDYGAGIAVDRYGNAYITGNSASTNLPVRNGPSLTNNGGVDAFVAKINTNGTALTYCGYVGGSDGEDGYSIAVDRYGNAYITGTTWSADLPVKNGPMMNYKGNGDGFVAKVNPSGKGLVYCGYIGGSDFEYMNSIALDTYGNAYVIGTTPSTDLPVKNGPFLSNRGHNEAYVAKINPKGTGFVYCGYIGGSSSDAGNGIAVDSRGNAYITGQTTSNDLPVKKGPRLTYNSNGDAYVAKINPQGTGLIYCGYIGYSDIDEGVGIAVDRHGNAYITGWTGCPEYPHVHDPALNFHDGIEAFIVKIDSTPPLVWATKPSGFYNYNQVVKLKMNEAGSIYYTLNGENPNTSSHIYNMALLITKSTILKFFAVDSAGNPSRITKKVYIIDKIAPKFRNTYPQQGYTHFSRTAMIKIVFNEKIKPSILYRYITVKKLSNNTSVGISKAVLGNTLYIKTTHSRSPNTSYKVTVPVWAIQDLAGNRLKYTYSLKFKTGT